MMKTMFTIFLTFTILFLMTLFVLGLDEDFVIVEIFDVYPEQLISKAFTLEKHLKVEIEAIIGIVRNDDQFLSTCWMLHAGTREVVWECSFDNGKLIDRGRALECREKLELKKGNYEIYYAINPSPGSTVKGVGSFLDFLFSGTKGKEYSRDWGVKIKAIPGKDAADVVHKYIPSTDEQAIVQLINLHDDQSVKKGFSLSSPLKVRIYAVGEGSRKNREMHDYGWIINAATRERIWIMSYRNTKYAGGADKNLKFDDIIQLPAGDYIVYFVTDDSHSSLKWNQLPPYDPTHWGITIWAVNGEYEEFVVKEYQEYEAKPIVEITRVRDDGFEMEGFELKRDAYLSILALGEYSRSRNEFVDYGRIVDARKRKTIWAMSYDNTEHAGGAVKNRVFDNRVFFKAGKYIVYYITDDSHSYNEWNSAKPYHPEAWGITISPSDKSLSNLDVDVYNEMKDEDIIAQLIEVGNDEKLQVEFKLLRSTDIRIYAIGEGDRSEMYDYGWIEDKWGDTVWNMEYRNTDHAGGAKKNRLFNDVINLGRGTYRLYYRTDDSHAYRRWNASPPDDRQHWGITLIRQ